MAMLVYRGVPIYQRRFFSTFIAIVGARYHIYNDRVRGPSDSWNLEPTNRFCVCFGTLAKGSFTKDLLQPRCFR